MLEMKLIHFSKRGLSEHSTGWVSIETVSAGGRSHGQRDWAFTPSGGGDMEIQKAYQKYNLVTSSVCLRHN